MQNLCPLLLMAGVLASAPAWAAKSSPEVTPAESAIQEARRAIAEQPGDAGGYNLLAMAMLRRVRETADLSYCGPAEDAAKKSLELTPGNFDGEKAKVAIMLARHEFPAALAAAKVLNKRVPDDVAVYGMMTDADVELGKYADAETQAQWMLNLLPGNEPALVRAAGLRDLFGDNDGSYELLQLAFDSTARTDIDERVFLRNRMAHLRLSTGNADAAAKLAEQALSEFPNNHWALESMAQVRMAQKRYDDAATLSRQLFQIEPRAAHLYEVAEALRLAGHADEARKAFAEFEAKALAESGGKDNSNRELVFYYADYAKQPAKALDVARKEFAWRQDVYTLDAYSWALHGNGQDAEARKQIEVALAVGILDARMLRHAGEIAWKLGDLKAAEGYLKQSADLNTLESEQAKTELAELAKAGH